MIPVGVGHVINFMVTKIHAARCNFMELRFPNMSPVFINQSDADIFVPAISLTKTGCKLKSSSTATHNYDFMHLNLRYQATCVS